MSERNCFNCRMFEEIDADFGTSYCHRREERHDDLSVWRDPYGYYSECWTGWIKGKLVNDDKEYFGDDYEE